MATKLCTTEGNWSSTDLTQCIASADTNYKNWQKDLALLKVRLGHFTDNITLYKRHILFGQGIYNPKQPHIAVVSVPHY